MKKYSIIVNEKDLKEIKEEKNPEDKCPFFVNWVIECIYRDKSFCKSDWRNGCNYAGITVNPGNGDAFCHKLMNLYFACEDIFEEN